jgi:hypothetical protein
MMSTIQPPRSNHATPAYVFLNGSFIIDRPVAAVWPLLLEYTSWQQYSSVERVSGEVGKVREVVLLKKEEPGLETFPQYFARTLLIEPGERVVWKTWPAHAAGGGPDFWGLVDFRVADEAGQTRFSYAVCYEFALHDKDERTLLEFEAETTAGFEEMMRSVFPKLKRLAEQGAI